MAGDGKIIIDVVLDDGSVGKGIANLDGKVKGLGDSGTTASLGIGKIITALGITALASKGIDMIKDSLDGAINRYDTLNQFPRVLEMMGFDAEESQGAIDKLSSGIDGLPTALDSVANTAQGIALMTGDLDGAVDTTLALNNAFLASGSSTADAERGLQQYVQMLGKGEVDLQSWRTLQETMPIGLNEVAKAFGFTGKAAQQDLYQALKDGNITFEEFNAQMVESSTKVGGFADIAQDASGGIKTSWTNVKTALVKGTADIIGAIDEALGGVGSIEGILDTFKEGIKTAFSTVVEWIPKAVSAAKEFYEAIKPWLPLLTAIVAGIVGFMTVVSIINSVKNAFVLLKGAIVLVNLAIMANPIALIIGLIIAAAILVYVYWEPISEFFIDLWEKISAGAVIAWDYMKEIWVTTIEFLKEAWSTVVEFFVNLWDSIKESAMSVWDAVIEKWNAVVEFFMSIFSPMVEFYSELWTTMTTTAIEIFQTFKDTIATVWDSIKTMASAAWELIKNVILAPILLLIDLATGDFVGFAVHLAQIQENIKSAASRLWEAMKTAVLAIITALVKTGLRLWDNFKSTLSNLMSAIKDVISNLWETLKSAVIRTIAQLVSDAIAKWNELKARAVEIVANIVKDLIQKWEDLKTKTLTLIKQVKDNVIDPLKEIDLLQVGKDIIQGLINGIKAKIAAVGDAVKDVTSAITGKIKSILRIESPSKITTELGEFTGEGVEVGLVKSIKNVAKAAGKVAESAMPDMDGFTNKLRGAKMPEVDLGFSANGGYAAKQSRGYGGSSISQSELSSESNKQPAVINVHVGSKQVASEIVDDITKLQDRTTNRNRRKPRGAFA